MRYNLGLLDMYPIEASGTVIENDPLFKIVMKEPVDPVVLEDAVYRAIKFHPLFGTQVRFDGTYYLTTNNRPIKLINSREESRPLEFGKNTNGYPWQLCWYDNEITFEWCHGVTDGRGTMEFLKSVLSMYCGMKFPVVPRKIELGPGLEPFVDRKQKGKNFDKQPKGFPVSALPIYKRGYKSDCHVISCSRDSIIKVAKENGGSPTAVLAVLLSLSLRKYLPKDLKNRNVAINVAFDLRKPLNYETQHNCCEFKRVTYQDKHDEMGFSAAVKEFKAALDNARIYENSVRILTDRVGQFRALHILPGKKLRKFAMGIIGKSIKDTDCNCELTYVGGFNLPDEVIAHVEDIQLRVWTDFGEAVIAAVEHNGIFNISLCENHVNKGFIEDFVNEGRAVGIDFVNTENFIYEQCKFIEEDEKEYYRGEEKEYQEKEIPVAVQPKPNLV